MKILHLCLALLCTLALASCGGGGGDTGTATFGGGSGSGTGDATGGVVVPVAADLSIVLSATTVSNAGTESVTATVTAVDAARNALSGIPVTVSVDNGGVAVVSAATTDTTGKVTAAIGIGADRSNRVISVTATSGSIVRVAAFQVTGAKLLATLLPAVVAPSTAAQVQYRLVDVNSNPMVGQAVSVSGAGVTAAQGVTGSNGEYTFAYTSPAAAGNLDLTATAGGVSLVQTVVVQSGAGTIPAVPGGSVQSASVSANPSVVAINTSTTNNRAEIRALFQGSANAPIPNVRVRFDLNGDSNSVGGTISSGTNLIYSDANGVATSAYVPGSRSSPTDGLTIRACWDYTDFAAGTCPNASLRTITVASEALSVRIGTDNTIDTTGAGGLTYIKKFVILVVDSAGQAKSDVQITPSIDLLSYIKGYYEGPGAWTRRGPASPAGAGFTGPTCLNEDANRNGVLDGGEDANANGQLDPRKADVAITMVGGSKTNASGVAVLQIEYPKNIATWVNFRILVAAGGISGTEGRDQYLGLLPADAASFTSTTPPAFVTSPYGIAATCANPN